MDLMVVQHGTAISIHSKTYALKRLFPRILCGPRPVRILDAGQQEQGRVRLVLSDGTWHEAVLPGEQPEENAPADLALTNVGQLLTFQDDGVGLMQDVSVVCRNGNIEAVHAGREKVRATTVIDARGGLLTPGLVDPHTHPVFAGQRSVEFGMKASGKTYLEIHKAGGGIMSTVRSTRAASFEELLQSCLRNLDRLLAWGVTTCEAKSGYALETEGELRLLEVLQAADNSHPLDLVPTFLGAHTLPPEMGREEYVSTIIEQMIPRVAQRGLARFCDAYCEDGAFTTQETERIFTAASAAGMGLRLHAEQFTDQGGAQLAARLGAASADHLEAISPAGIQALAHEGTHAVLLPGAALACRCPWPPARDLLDAGVSVALGTDLNPGSSFTASLPLMMSLACMQMQVSCEEAWRAVTCNAARSLGRDDIGQVAPGSQADLVLFDVPDYRYVPYGYGENHARLVIKRGQVVWCSSDPTSCT